MSIVLPPIDGVALKPGRQGCRSVLSYRVIGNSSCAAPYKATEEGLRRKPILFMFGRDYAPAFIAANRRAAAARDRHSGERRAIPAETARRPSMALPVGLAPKSPKNKSAAESSVLMGEVRTGKPIGIPPKAFVSDPKLEAALANLLELGIRRGRG